MGFRMSLLRKINGVCGLRLVYSQNSFIESETEAEAELETEMEIIFHL